MKGKEKQIEEMAMIMCENNCEECRRESIEFYGNSYDEDTQCLFNVGAERLYNAGYRKIPENSVVLTNDNAEEIANLIVTSPQTQSVMGDLIKAWRKETVEKILEFIQENRHKYEMWYLVSELRKFFGIEQNNDWVFGDLADELNNKFGVEIKE